METNQPSEVWAHSYVAEFCDWLGTIPAENSSISLDFSYVERVSFSCVQALVIWANQHSDKAIHLIISQPLQQALDELGATAFFEQKGTVECR